MPDKPNHCTARTAFYCNAPFINMNACKHFAGRYTADCGHYEPSDGTCHCREAQDEAKGESHELETNL